MSFPHIFQSFFTCFFLPFSLLPCDFTASIGHSATGAKKYHGTQQQLLGGGKAEACGASYGEYLEIHDA